MPTSPADSPEGFGQSFRSRKARTRNEDRAVAAGLTALRVAAVSGATGSAAALAAATIQKTHTIHDLDGSPLFFDVDLARDDQAAGTMRVAADERVGRSFVSLETRPRTWDPDSAIKTALKKAPELLGGGRVSGARLVCYSYPKIGVQVAVKGPSGTTGTVILDAADFNAVNVTASSDLEGDAAYSFLAETVEPELDARTRRFENQEEIEDLLRKQIPEFYEPRFPLDPGRYDLLHERLKGLVDAPVPTLFQRRVLPMSPRCHAHECFELYGQQTSVYCAVATAQMILDWHRRYFTQDQIAAAMSTGPSGTSNSNQVSGYESLSHGCMNATFVEPAQFATAQAQINAGRPLKSGVRHHARAVAGWSSMFNVFGFGWEHSLLVYDPWPWNANICDGGSVYWEDWDAITHTNWITIRNRTTTH